MITSCRARLLPRGVVVETTAGWIRLAGDEVALAFNILEPPGRTTRPSHDPGQRYLGPIWDG